MSEDQIPHPPIASESEWLAERKKLLTEEKELTKHHDRVSAARRTLPMVKIDKDYVFEGSNGKVTLLDLFEGCRQLIVYHFMFDPAWEKGCVGCTGYVDALGDLSLLKERDTNFVLISRAPFAKLATYQTLKGWNVPWFSSFGSDFNYDYHVTLDASFAPVEYNYRSQTELTALNKGSIPTGEEHGNSVFFRLDSDIYHTYSTYARGTEWLTDTYSLLDITPYGRQEDWENSPSGWPQKPTYG